MIDPIRRRTFLSLLGATGSVSALPAFATLGLPHELVLVDSRLTHTELTGVRVANPHLAKAINHQSIQEWRRSLSDLLEQGGPLTAYTRWDIALLLADLGREAGRMPRRTTADNGIEITSFA